MRVLDGVADDAEQAQACLEGQRLSAAPVGDGNAVHELHHEEGRAVGREAAVQQAGDVGVLEGRQHLPLGAEALAGIRIARAGAHELDRHLELILAVGARGAVDQAHAAAPDDASQAPRAQRPAQPGIVRRGSGECSSTTSRSMERAEPARREPPASPRLPCAARLSPAQARSRKPRARLGRAARAPARTAPRDAPSSARPHDVGGHVSSDLLSKPCPRRGPAPLHGLGGQIEDAGGLFEGQPAEDAALDDLPGPLVEQRQAIERQVDGQNFLDFEGGEQRRAPRRARGNPACRAPPRFRRLRARAWSTRIRRIVDPAMARNAVRSTAANWRCWSSRR